MLGHLDNLIMVKEKQEFFNILNRSNFLDELGSGILGEVNSDNSGQSISLDEAVIKLP